MATKSKEAAAAAEFNSVIGEVYDFVPDAKWDGKEYVVCDAKKMLSAALGCQ